MAFVYSCLFTLLAMNFDEYYRSKFVSTSRFRLYTRTDQFSYIILYYYIAVFRAFVNVFLTTLSFTHRWRHSPHATGISFTSLLHPLCCYVFVITTLSRQCRWWRHHNVTMLCLRHQRIVVYRSCVAVVTLTTNTCVYVCAFCVFRWERGADLGAVAVDVQGRCALPAAEELSLPGLRQVCNQVECALFVVLFILKHVCF